MNKLSNLIFVRREGLEQKWWHRLAQVLIWGSTIVIAVFTFLLFFVGNSFVHYSYSAYNFQPNFATAKGKIESCTFEKGGDPEVFNSTKTARVLYNPNSPTNGFNPIQFGATPVFTNDGDFYSPEIICGDVNFQAYDSNENNYPSIKEFLYSYAQYNENSQEHELLFNSSGQDEMLIPVDLNIVMNGGIDRGDFSNIQTKRVTHFLLRKFIVSILEFVGIILGWFILWESIIYRTIIYIIYGKSK